LSRDGQLLVRANYRRTPAARSHGDQPNFCFVQIAVKSVTAVASAGAEA